MEKPLNWKKIILRWLMAAGLIIILASIAATGKPKALYILLDISLTLGAFLFGLDLIYNHGKGFLRFTKKSGLFLLGIDNATLKEKERKTCSF